MERVAQQKKVVTFVLESFSIYDNDRDRREYLIANSADMPDLKAYAFHSIDELKALLAEKERVLDAMVLNKKTMALNKKTMAIEKEKQRALEIAQRSQREATAPAYMIGSINVLYFS